MKRLIFLLLALLVAGSASAATKVQVMTDGVIDVDRLPTISFFQETDPEAPVLGQVWWNNATNQLKVAGAAGVYSFTGTLAAWDTTPEAFSFTDVTNATTSTVYTSAPITVSGINWPAAISVAGSAGAAYSVNNGIATSANGTVMNGDSVAAMVMSSDSYGTETNATITIGSVSDTYTVTTEEDTSFSWAVEDDFTTDTTANYTGNNYIDGSSETLVYDAELGAVKSPATWRVVSFRHNTEIGTDQAVQALVTASGVGGESGVLLAFSGVTGYGVRVDSAVGRVYLDKMNGATEWAEGATLTLPVTWTEGDSHWLLARIVDGVVSVFIDWNDDEDFDDVNESIGSFAQDTTFTGTYAGLYWFGNGSETCWTYAFKAGAL